MLHLLLLSWTIVCGDCVETRPFATPQKRRLYSDDVPLHTASHVLPPPQFKRLRFRAPGTDRFDWAKRIWITLNPRQRNRLIRNMSSMVSVSFGSGMGGFGIVLFFK